MTKILRNLALALLVLSFMAVAPAAYAELLIWDSVGPDCAQVVIYDKETADPVTSYAQRGTQDSPSANKWFVLDPANYTKDVRYSFVGTCKDTNGDESGYSDEARYTFWTGGGGTKGPLPPGSFGIVNCQNNTDPNDTYYQICVDSGEIQQQ